MPRKMHKRTIQRRKNKPTNVMGKQISLLSEPVTRRITRPTIIYTNTTTQNYSFTSGSDVRFLAFSNILSSTEFGNMSNVFNQYKIISCLLTMIPVVFTPFSQPCGAAFIEVEPNITPANPTNLTLLESDTAKMFNPSATVTEWCNWTLKGVSAGFNIWENVANVASQIGQVSLGSNTGANAFAGASLPLYDVRLELVVSFTDPK
jgi:hypothetical protein